MEDSLAPAVPKNSLFHNDKPVLISTDIDDCLIPWDGRKRNGPFNEAALERAVGVVKQSAHQLAFHLNTGRNLASLKNLVDPNARACPILDTVQVDFISTNNGQELYINRHHQPTADWIRALTDDQTDSDWTAEIERKTGWALPKVVSARETLMHCLGFQEIHGAEAQALALPTYRGLRIYTKTLTQQILVTIQCFDTQPGYRTSSWSSTEGHQFTSYAEETGLLLQKQLQEALHVQFGTETSLGHKPMEAGGAHFGAFTLFPMGVHKGAVVDMLMNSYMPHVKAVITVGDDAYNDLDLLRPLTFKVHQQDIPCYPVAVGENEEARQTAAVNPRHELVEVENWDHGIQKQLDKLSRAGIL